MENDHPVYSIVCTRFCLLVLIGSKLVGSLPDCSWSRWGRLLGVPKDISVQ
uniref:Uncharacterized protein n=1 Tax=Anguilla anguilla TaxID=7936 RepID=A0A0E9WJ19_ANGAN